MKWPQDQVEILDKAINDWLDKNLKHINRKTFRESYENNPRGFSFSIYSYVTHDLMFDDNHPAYTRNLRKRVIPHDPNFVLYPDGCNDDHLATVLKHIFSNVLKGWEQK